ncbi:hypothetical protein AHMF7605_10550 [Adhaeribacter arboris]|uniref:Uncharacterized protein n=1 Tax=Adhaeribacter arboris TaxID=2072846 RepID=A0A2T2YEI5_9BACT|nr:hypothetical protein [Adhaeribacter arboris]PSR53926.1 hypothetical protein AHMF7605_10550 [Adhaeribacter arboris]
MHLVELKYNKKRIEKQVPASWNELSGKQLVRVIAALLTIRDKHTLQLTLIQILLQVKSSFLNLCTVEQKIYLAQLTQFITKGGLLTKQLLPVISLGKWRRQKYYGPASSFRNLLFLEFIFSDTYFIAWSKKQNEELLNKFIACLYRERTWFHFIKKRFSSYNGDNRRAFNSHLVEVRAHKLAQLPLEVKQSIVLWYRGCREELEKDYPRVFSGDNQQAAERTGWDGVLRNMAGSVHQLEATGQASARNVFALMEDRLYYAELAERKNKQAS